LTIFPKEVVRMREIRNSDGRLVCHIEDSTGTVEIRIKDCITLITRTPDGKTEVVNTKNHAN
jgi:hypothetical protein